MGGQRSQQKESCSNGKKGTEWCIIGWIPQTWDEEPSCPRSFVALKSYSWPSCEILLTRLACNQAAPSAIITAVVQACSTWWGPSQRHLFLGLLLRSHTMIQSPGSRSCSGLDAGGESSTSTWDGAEDGCELSGFKSLMFTEASDLVLTSGVVFGADVLRSSSWWDGWAGTWSGLRLRCSVHRFASSRFRSAFTLRLDFWGHLLRRRSSSGWFRWKLGLKYWWTPPRLKGRGFLNP